jgi:hypothetical protein
MYLCRCFTQVTGMLEAYSWADPLRELIEQNPAVADFALAWILTKFTEPVSATSLKRKAGMS